MRPVAVLRKTAAEGADDGLHRIGSTGCGCERNGIGVAEWLMELTNVLIIEDDPDDAELIRRFLEADAGGNFRPEVVSTLALAMKGAASKQYDVVLLDLTLPDSTGIETVRKVVRWYPDLPVIVLTARSGDKTAIESLRYGAQDYIEKKHVSSAWLGRAVRHAIERRQILNQKEELLTDLGAALEEIEKLEKALDVCSCCKKIRNEKGKWEPLDSYLQTRAGRGVKQGICPECAASLSAAGQPDPCRR